MAFKNRNYIKFNYLVNNYCPLDLNVQHKEA